MDESSKAAAAAAAAISISKPTHPPLLRLQKIEGSGTVRRKWKTTRHFDTVHSRRLSYKNKQSSKKN
jgi:hypothetical protein